MKTRKQKVISRILCMVVSIFLLTSFFVVPVSAEQDYFTTTFVQDVENFDTSYFRTFAVGGYDEVNKKTSKEGLSADSATSYGEAHIEYQFDYQNSINQGISVLYLGASTLHNTEIDSSQTFYFQKGDTAWLSPGWLHIGIKGDQFAIMNFRFVLRESRSTAAGDRQVHYGRVIAQSEVINTRIDDNGNGHLQFDSVSFEFLESISTTSLTLCLELFSSSYHNYDRIVFFLQNEFYLNYGAGKNPNYPIYPNAPGGDEIGGLGSKEDQLLNDSSAGLQEGVNSIGKVNGLLSGGKGVNGTDLHLAAFATNLSGIMERIAGINGIGDLVYISLSLGLFASLFGLAGSIISAADRKAGQAKREAAHSANKK